MAYTVGSHGPGSGPHSNPAPQRPSGGGGGGLPPAVRNATQGVANVGQVAQHAQAQQQSRQDHYMLPPILKAPSANAQQTYKRALAETFLYQPDNVKLAILKSALVTPSIDGTTILNFVHGVGVDKVIGHSLRDNGPGAAATTPAGYGLIPTGGSQPASSSGAAAPAAASSRHLGGNVTPASFGVAALRALGITPTPANMQAFTAWEQQEGGHWNNTAHYNPLNTTLPEPGYSQTGTQGNIGSYTSWDQGLKATVDTLKHYPGILASLKRGDSVSGLSSAVSGSPWGTGGVNAPGQHLSAQEIAALDHGSHAAGATAGPGNVAYYGLKGKQYKQAAASLAKVAGTMLQTHGPGVGPASSLLVGSGGKYVHPFPAATIGRTDMGVDASGLPNGYPLRAIGDSKVIGIQQNWYNGQPFVAMKFLNGSQKGKYWYIAEGIIPSVSAGDTVKAGRPVGHFHNYGNGLEAGFGTSTPGTTLAKATTGYTEGQVTPAGLAFGKFLSSLK